MANQRTPSTDAVLDNTVEKIILSGSPFTSSILGPNAYLITAPAAPVFLSNPVIIGDDSPPGSQTIPLLLTCLEPSFSSSPRATITYSWEVNSIIRGGETSTTLVPLVADIGLGVRCRVDITNASGTIFAFSNLITIAAPNPVSVYELDAMVIGGMSDPKRTTVNDADISIIMGLGHYLKIDINETDLNVITGVASNGKVDIIEADAYEITGLVNEDKIDIDEADAYAITLYTRLTPLVVVNGDAELVSMAAWTMDTNTVTSVTTAPSFDSTYREGLRFFMPAQLGWGVDSQMSQVIVIPGGDLTDVDTGLCYCVAKFRHMSGEGYDKLVITLEALNAADGVLATTVYSPAAGPTEEWMLDSTADNPLTLPTLTRKVKITILFDAHPSERFQPNNDVYADAFTIELLKTA